MSRLNANRQIVQTLTALVEAFPDMRFHQLLVNADVIKTDPHSEGPPTVRNEYHVESTEILSRMLQSSLMEVQYDRDDE